MCAPLHKKLQHMHSKLIMKLKLPESYLGALPGDQTSHWPEKLIQTTNI